MGRLWVLALGSFSLGTDVFVFAGILPEVAGSMAVSTGMAGLLVSVFAFTYALASPVLAVATGNMDRRNLLIGSFGVFCVANIVSATALTYEVLLASRILAALGAALYMPTASALAVSLAPAEKRGRALSIVTGGMTVAIVLGVPLGTWIAGYAGWRMTFWFVAAMGAVALLGIGLRIPQVTTAQPVGWGARMALLKQPQVIAALSLTVLWTAGGFTIYPYLSPLLSQLTHLSLPEIGWMLLLFGAASVVGNFIGGHGADRWGATTTMAIALALLVAVFTTLSWSASHVATAILSIVLWGIAGWMLTPPQQHRLVGLAPQIPGAILGLNGSAIYFGMRLGTSLGAALIQGASIQWLSWAGGAFELLALLLLLAPALSGTYKAAQGRSQEVV
ncbi:MAG: MFS transporter [Nitrosomonadales bacterium]|nr:MFS transporter [Nitrosomonadales bacterium]